MGLVNLALVLVVMITIFALLGFGDVASALGSLFYIVIVLIIVLFLVSLVADGGWYGLSNMHLFF